MSDFILAYAMEQDRERDRREERMKKNIKRLRKLIKGVTKMHSKSFYDNYSSSEGALEEIEGILNEMENDIE